MFFFFKFSMIVNIQRRLIKSNANEQLDPKYTIAVSDLRVLFLVQHLPLPKIQLFTYDVFLKHDMQQNNNLKRKAKFLIKWLKI